MYFVVALLTQTEKQLKGLFYELFKDFNSLNILHLFHFKHFNVVWQQKKILNFVFDSWRWGGYLVFCVQWNQRKWNIKIHQKLLLFFPFLLHKKHKIYLLFYPVNFYHQIDNFIAFVFILWLSIEIFMLLMINKNCISHFSSQHKS